MPAARAERRTDFGRGIRADRAAVTGMRATDRAGHHAAPVATTTAIRRPSPSTGQGRSRRSIR